MVIHLCLGLPNGLFHHVIPIDIFCAVHLSPICVACPNHFVSYFVTHPNVTEEGNSLYNFFSFLVHFS
jgi:hypothetical protein